MSKTRVRTGIAEARALAGVTECYLEDPVGALAMTRPIFDTPELSGRRRIRLAEAVWGAAVEESDDRHRRAVALAPLCPTR
ncbi:hypothetical protein ACQP2U_13085 [Nocardia sp. CA-084685]|uniref:hypothetical protein n=1 Tax=Nocardia sp. CA-084685 TaxID=3239970 RepID=UPI003D9961F1